MIVLWLALALAEEFHVVERGDTLASIAAALGDPALEVALRARNGLGPGEEPVLGDLLTLPEGVAAVSCQPSYVISHHGGGTVVLPGSDPVPLRDYQPLPAGSVVCTDADSFAAVRMSAQVDARTYDDVTLMPLTCVQVRSSGVVGARRSAVLGLRQGGLAVQGAVPGAGRVVVQTEAGLTLGDGGAFRVAVEPGAVRAEAVGAPVVTFGGGAAVDLPAGFGNRTAVGAAPGDPVPLLAPPALDRPLEDSELRRPDFSWTHVPDALTYAVELSESPRFDRVVYRHVDGPNRWEPAGLMLGYGVPALYWRVTARDRTGFEGLPSPPRRLRFPAGVPAKGE